MSVFWRSSTHSGTSTLKQSKMAQRIDKISKVSRTTEFPLRAASSPDSGTHVIADTSFIYSSSPSSLLGSMVFKSNQEKQGFHHQPQRTHLSSNRNKNPCPEKWASDFPFLAKWNTMCFMLVDFYKFVGHASKSHNCFLRSHCLKIPPKLTLLRVAENRPSNCEDKQQQHFHSWETQAGEVVNNRYLTKIEQHFPLACFPVLFYHGNLTFWVQGPSPPLCRPRNKQVGIAGHLALLADPKLLAKHGQLFTLSWTPDFEIFDFASNECWKRGGGFLPIFNSQTWRINLHLKIRGIQLQTRAAFRLLSKPPSDTFTRPVFNSQFWKSNVLRRHLEKRQHFPQAFWMILPS